MSDLISRQAAIRWIKAECNPYGKPTLDFESGKKIIEHLGQMPSAYRPTGEWEQVPYKRQGHEEVVTDGHSWRCSNCGDARKRNQPDMRFCPNCGARMKGADNDS